MIPAVDEVVLLIKPFMYEKDESDYFAVVVAHLSPGPVRFRTQVLDGQKKEGETAMKHVMAEGITWRRLTVLERMAFTQ